MTFKRSRRDAGRGLPHGLLCGLVVVLAVMFSRPGWADSAAECIKLVGVTPPVAGDPARRSQVIKNVCNRTVGIMWCHDGGNALKGAETSACGAKGQFYQQRKSLAPGETHDNYFTLPASGNIRWAACFDNQYHLKQQNPASDAYYCDYPKKGSGTENQNPSTTQPKTASAPTSTNTPNSASAPKATTQPTTAPAPKATTQPTTAPAPKTATQPTTASAPKATAPSSPVGAWLADTGESTTSKLVLSGNGGARYNGEFPGRWTQSGDRVRVELFGNEVFMRRNEPAVTMDLKLTASGMSGIQDAVFFNPPRRHKITLTRTN